MMNHTDSNFIFVRFKFSKLKEFKYLSHLDILGIVSRALLRSGIKVRFDLSFNPKPKAALSNPIPLGVESMAEYCDVELKEDIGTSDFMEIINKNLPDLIRVTAVSRVYDKLPNVMSQADIVLYEFIIGRDRGDIDSKAEINQMQEITPEEFYNVEDFTGIFKDWLQKNPAISGTIYKDEIYNLEKKYPQREKTDMAPYGNYKLGIYGYVKVLKENNNAIFKFNIFKQNLTGMLGQLNLNVKSVFKKELYLIKNGKLVTLIDAAQFEGQG